MGKVFALLSRKNKDVLKPALQMLDVLKTKGSEEFVLGSKGTMNLGKTIESLRNKWTDSPVLAGYVSTRKMVSETTQKTMFNRGFFIFEGRIFTPEKGSFPIKSIYERVKGGYGLDFIIKEFDGRFSFIEVGNNRFLAGRDSVGVCPLYYGENSDFMGLASERKALWKIGLRKNSSFPPGHMAVFDKDKVIFKPVKTISQAKRKKKKLLLACQDLERLIEASIQQRVSDFKHFSVAFSGGLDSTIIAFLAKKAGVDVHLIHVCQKGQAEMEHAQEVAEILDLPIHIRYFNQKEVEEVLPRVLWLIEESNAIKTSIGIPIFWAAEKTFDIGLRVMLTGQGADELFGGYRKYLDCYKQQGKRFVEKMIIKDISRMYKDNIERDSKICSFFGIELRLPYASYSLVEFAIQLPLQLKIDLNNERPRKIILRRMARKFGLPSCVVEKPKKAIQYTTGVNKIIKKLAKRNGLPIREYLQRQFQNIVVNL
jgi:asparagine synthase (glutamine-hydrolysing)